MRELLVFFDYYFFFPDFRKTLYIKSGKSLRIWEWNHCNHHSVMIRLIWFVLWGVMSLRYFFFSFRYNFSLFYYSFRFCRALWIVIVQFKIMKKMWVFQGWFVFLRLLAMDGWFSTFFIFFKVYKFLTVPLTSFSILLRFLD